MKMEYDVKIMANLAVHESAAKDILDGDHVPIQAVALHDGHA